ncbi:MAG: HPF/RaiA family ribosome-associated protein [Gemmatimonadetes bacterium]|nr:hypothetical protein [Gemmatimonadota bacterium]MDE2678901.1 hypothetical protein [Gemmatimonadota bacterium]MXX35946.1 HPF/RaiA family ribosome-associated protein [Gemmatimonadota bacterium]MYA10484.1 HPF/RaiA family ribosome-associated protein [Gemmatimonadota bacterium]MYD13569.1 HPF/RaiA family ribosome-associated protein [Gemmatimonadota bacterium]
MIPTRITAHGCEISSTVRTQAEGLAQRWPRFDPAVMEVSFVFGMEGRDHTSEAIVSRRRRQAVVASGQGPDFRVALDDLDCHMRRILRKDRQKRKDYRNS